MLGWRVDTDGEQPGAGCEELFVSGCQADQLAVAIRSPIATEEDEQRSAVELIGELPRTAGLIDGGRIVRHGGTLVLQVFPLPLVVRSDSGHACRRADPERRTAGCLFGSFDHCV